MIVLLFVFGYVVVWFAVAAAVYLLDSRGQLLDPNGTAVMAVCVGVLWPLTAPMGVMVLLVQFVADLVQRTGAERDL